MNSIDKNLTLEGFYVNLRPLRVEDAALTFRWRQSPRAVLLNRGAATVEQQTRWIANRPATEYNFIIETKACHPVGTLSLTGIDMNNRIGEPGRFLIGDEASAQGLPVAVEAMKLLYELAFDQLELRRIWGIVAAENRRMIKWQSYLGMTKEGCLRQHLFINGHFQDAIVFGLLAEECRRTTLPRLASLIAATRLPVLPAIQPG